MNLSDFISPDTMVARSINLERDMGNRSILHQYHLTGKGLEIISRFDAKLHDGGKAAWSLIGPYGMGKSSFSNFLLALCGPESETDTQTARRMLAEKNPELYRRFSSGISKHSTATGGLLRVPATASFEPLNRTLAKGLHRAVQKSECWPEGCGNGARLLVERTAQLSNADVPESSQLVELFKEASQLYGAPVALVIDEFGKNLEFLARHPARGDLYVLQQLAESEEGLYLWVCLHQAFDQYASRMTSSQIQEWGKIHGRFEDISFVEPRYQMIRFIGETLKRKDHPQLNKAVRRWAEEFSAAMEQHGLLEFGKLNVEELDGLYPLHPLTALILPELCVRFAQNDRTLFAFLCGGEPNAIPAFLAAQSADLDSGVLPTFGPELLYDYFLASSASALMNRPESHRWIEIHDIIERSRNLDPFVLKVLKTIGLLNLISGPSRFRASKALLSLAFLRPKSGEHGLSDELRRILDENISSGVLIYRDYADEYRLWEGSDFDIPAAILEKKGLFAKDPLGPHLKDSLPLMPLTASRHSYRTGTLRHFERRWCAVSDLEGKLPTVPSPEFDGLLLYCFGKGPLPESFFNAMANGLEDGRPLVIAYNPCEEEIREMVLDAAAAREVLTKSRELDRDGVARKEARFRASAAEECLRSTLAELFSPGNDDVNWHAMGSIRTLRSHRDLSQLLSECCDKTYEACPILRNELINRNRLSSAAARARRELMEAMVSRESEVNLGLQGSGPEVAVYLTMLKEEGMHRELKDATEDAGTWNFLPPGNGSSYHRVWKDLSEAIEQAGDENVPVSFLIDKLRRPPYGLKEGPIPVLLCLFLIINSDEVALYQEGAFIPNLGAEEMELMTKRPEYFSIRRFAPGRVREKLLNTYISLLDAQSVASVRRLRNATLVSVVAPLVRFVKGLPAYTLQTRSLSQAAQSVRHALLQARDPVDLIFTDIPRALDLDSFEDSRPVSEETIEQFRSRFSQAILELKQAYSQLLSGIEETVSKAFGIRAADPAALRAQLQDRAQPLVERCTDRGLRPLLGILASHPGTFQEWLVSIATVAIQRPVDSWRDTDRENFFGCMRDLALQLGAFETLIARALNDLPAAGGGQEPRMVSLSRPDGRTATSLLWMDEVNIERARSTLNTILDGVDNRSELEALFLLLGDHLLSPPSDKEPEHD